MENHPAHRGLGVDLFRQALKLNSACVEVVQDVDQIPHTPAQPVELPHRQRVAMLKNFETAEEGRALKISAAYAFVGEGLAATGLFQSGQLQRRVLIVG